MDFSWVNNKKLCEVTRKIPRDWRFVGGCVRDSILEIFTHNTKLDIDINTLATPDEIIKCLQGIKYITIFEIGKKFGTISVYFKDDKYEWLVEITTLRIDIETDGRHATVQFLTSNDGDIDTLFKIDCSRRDFTINSIMYIEKIIDYFNGVNDLLNKKVIFIGDSHLRITEDYLRIIRYIRFTARFGGNDMYDYNYFVKYFDQLKTISKERIISEIEKMLKYNLKGIELLNLYGISKLFFGIDLNIKECIIELQFVSLFINVEYEYIKKWPFSRVVKHYIYLLKYFNFSSDIFDILAKIWRLHGCELAKIFVQLYCIKNINSDIKILLAVNWQKPLINFESIEPKLRSQTDERMRSYYLKEMYNILMMNK